MFVCLFLQFRQLQTPLVDFFIYFSLIVVLTNAQYILKFNTDTNSTKEIQIFFLKCLKFMLNILLQNCVVIVMFSSSDHIGFYSRFYNTLQVFFYLGSSVEVSAETRTMCSSRVIITLDCNGIALVFFHLCCREADSPLLKNEWVMPLHMHTSDIPLLGKSPQFMIWTNIVITFAVVPIFTSVCNI